MHRFLQYSFNYSDNSKFSVSSKRNGPHQRPCSITKIRPIWRKIEANYQFLARLDHRYQRVPRACNCRWPRSFFPSLVVSRFSLWFDNSEIESRRASDRRAYRIPFIFSLPDARAQPDGQPMVIDSKTKLTLLNRSPRAPFKKCQLYDTRGFYKIRGMKGVRAFNDLVTIGFR